MSLRRVDPERLAAARAVIGLACLRDFAAALIAHVSSGGALDEAALDRLRAGCIRDLKNADAAGLSIEQQAEVLGQLVEYVENLIDGAIIQGRERQKR